MKAGRAQVAELVDALVSGISGGNTVGVRVPSWAPSGIAAERLRFEGGAFVRLAYGTTKPASFQIVAPAYSCNKVNQQVD